MSRAKLDGAIATTVTGPNERVRMECVVYNTRIFAAQNDRSVELDTGGWNTPLTRRRMNACFAAMGFRTRVVQRKGILYAQTSTGRRYPFTNNRLTLQEHQYD